MKTELTQFLIKLLAMIVMVLALFLGQYLVSHEILTAQELQGLVLQLGGLGVNSSQTVP